VNSTDLPVILTSVGIQMGAVPGLQRRSGSSSDHLRDMT
jgi:hypothetical protein